MPGTFYGVVPVISCPRASLRGDHSTHIDGAPSPATDAKGLNPEPVNTKMESRAIRDREFYAPLRTTGFVWLCGT